MNARQKLLQTAKSLRGQRDTVIDDYNRLAKPLPLGYRVKYEDMGCAVYVSVPYLLLGWDIVAPHCRARELYRNMAALGRAHWGHDRTPEPGDLLFFGPGGNESRIDHVGIVEEVKTGTISYWDLRSVVGNHTCKVGGGFIKGYGYIMAYAMPDYASKDTDEPDPEPAPAIKAGDLVRIRTGAKWYSGGGIKASVMAKNWYVVQNKNGRVVLGMSEDERSNIQSPIHEEDVELVVQFGPQPEPVPEPDPGSVIRPTVAVELPVLRKGAQGRIVETLQLLLNRWHFTVEVDGIFGADTEQALLAFQLEWGIEGTHAQVDRLTWANLLG